MSKILIIGQAPPRQTQRLPYDTTMLYDWLNELGISKEKAQDIFDFEAMTDKVPETNSNGHIPPSLKEKQEYYSRVLKTKIENSKSVILLGRSAMDFFNVPTFYTSTNNGFHSLIHPSRRNYNLYKSNKERVLKTLRNAVKPN